MSNEVSDEQYNKVIQLKKLVIHQLTNSKDMNMRYKIRADFIHNHKSENYVKMMMKRTGLSKIDLFDQATTFVCSINTWLFHELCDLQEETLSAIMNDPKSMDKFLKKVNDKIGDDPNDVFLQKCDKCIH
jgi:hypothetical protein